MKATRVVIVLLMVVLPVITAHAGVFREDFSDGNLDQWHIETAPGPPWHPVRDFLTIENGYLVINTVRNGQQHSVILKLNTRNSERWDSYTLTCRIRFKSHVNLEPPSIFSIQVRYSEGGVVEVNPHRLIRLEYSQFMLIHNDRLQRLSVSTIQPVEPPAGFPLGFISRVELRQDGLERRIWDRWIPIKIVAKGELFEFNFDDQLVAKYRDDKAGPGTVRFWSQSRLTVHLDDIAITGPRIPDIGPRSVDTELNSVTTWGEIKNPSRRKFPLGNTSRQPSIEH